MLKNIFYKLLFILILSSSMVFIAILFIVQYNNVAYSKVMIRNIINLLEREIIIYEISQFDDFRKFILQSDKNEVRMSIISTNGMLLADTIHNVYTNNSNNTTSHTKNDIIQALHSPNREIAFAVNNSTLKRDQYLYGSKKIKTVDNKYYILRIAIPIEPINKYFITFLFIIVFVIGSILIVVSFVLPLMTRNMMLPFYTIKERLDNIYTNKTYKTKNLTQFVDVNNILYDINELAINLNKNINGYKIEREKLNDVLEHIAEGIIAIDANKDIFFINQFAMHLLCISDTNCNSLEEIFSDKEILEKINSLIDTSTFSKFDIKGRDESVDIGVTITPVTNNENIIAFIKLNDVTDVRKVEVEKQDFFINASHELKTPLTSILGYSELLLNTGLSDRSLDFIKRINYEALRMKNLVVDMLTLSRMEGNIKEYIDSELKVTDLIINTIESNKIKADSRNISITIEKLDDVYIIANSEKVIEVFNNLLDNAIKYTNDGGSVFISLEDKKNYAVFTVRDTGCGISSKYLNRIFERFFRVKNDKYLEVQGTGLGLTIVKNICNYYNADIKVKSKEGVGTEVIVSFPILPKNIDYITI